MNVVLLAATGRAGKTTLAELISRGHSVTAVARDPAKLGTDLPASVRVVQDDTGLDQSPSLGLDDRRVSTLNIRSVGPTRRDPVMTDSLVDASAQPRSYVSRHGAAGRSGRTLSSL
jgi:putative NADH-flavin reductase